MGHLSSALGAHILTQGDIHPTNIMFGVDETPVLVDFDSCVKIGELMIGKSGHPGWAKKVRSPHFLGVTSYEGVT